MGIEKFKTWMRVIASLHLRLLNIINIKNFNMLFTLYAKCHNLDKYLRHEKLKNHRSFYQNLDTDSLCGRLRRK
jgi:hypothetical protein